MVIWRSVLRSKSARRRTHYQPRTDRNPVDRTSQCRIPECRIAVRMITFHFTPLDPIHPP
jgi:hypothetical protein